MVNLKTLVIYFVALLLLTSCTTTQSIPKNNYRTVVDGLQIETYGDSGKAKLPVILIFLHGDRCRADYTKNLAKSVVMKNVLSFVMARPGCELNRRYSRGNHGNSDHYTKENIAAVSKSINSLKQHYKASKVILVGHSGGAATAGIVAGKYPELINAFVAVSFPANVPRWRIHRNKGSIWARSLSPHDYINRISPLTKIFIVNGSKDTNTIPSLSTIYAEAAKEHGLNINNIILKGENHNSTLKAYRVRLIITSLIKTLRTEALPKILI